MTKPEILVKGADWSVAPRWAEFAVFDRDGNGLFTNDYYGYIHEFHHIHIGYQTQVIGNKRPEYFEYVQKRGGPVERTELQPYK